MSASFCVCARGPPQDGWLSPEASCAEQALAEGYEDEPDAECGDDEATLSLSLARSLSARVLSGLSLLSESRAVRVLA